MSFFFWFLERCEAVPLVLRLMRCDYRQRKANGMSDPEDGTMISDKPKAASPAASPTASPAASPATSPEARI